MWIQNSNRLIFKNINIVLFFLLHISRWEIVAKWIDKINNIRFRKFICLWILFQLYNIHINDIMDFAWFDRIIIVLDIEVLPGEQCLCKLLCVIGINNLHLGFHYFATFFRYILVVYLCYYKQYVYRQSLQWKRQFIICCKEHKIIRLLNKQFNKSIHVHTNMSM